MRATRPVVWQGADGSYTCQMRDRKGNRIWGEGFGLSRTEAIQNARLEMPAESHIKKVIGWVVRHPFIGGTVAGAYLLYRYAKKHGIKVGMRGYLGTAVLAGGVCWVASKVVKFVKHLMNR